VRFRKSGSADQQCLGQPALFSKTLSVAGILLVSSENLGPDSLRRGVGICRSALPSGYVGYFGRLALNTCHQELFAASGSLCDARHELRRSDGFHLRGLKKRIFAQKRNSLCVHRIAEVRDCRCFKPIEPPIFQSSKRRRSQARLLTSDSPQERGLS
jgi:hypothetical protein